MTKKSLFSALLVLFLVGCQSQYHFTLNNKGYGTKGEELGVSQKQIKDFFDAVEDTAMQFNFEVAYTDDMVVNTYRDPANKESYADLVKKDRTLINYIFVRFVEDKFFQMGSYQCVVMSVKTKDEKLIVELLPCEPLKTFSFNVMKDLRDRLSSFEAQGFVDIEFVPEMALF